MRKLTSFSLILCFVTLSNLSSQNVVYVAPNGSGSGSSWSDPMGDIAAAVAAAKANAKDVWIKGGVYDVTAEITVNAVKIYGGFAGTEAALEQRTLTSDEPWSFANPSEVRGNNSARVFYANAASSLIDGFTITNGGGVSSNLSGMGGGIMITGNAKVQNCVIKNNKSTSNDGGGVAILSGTLSNSLVEQNQTQGPAGNKRGGGIFANPGASVSATIVNSVIRNNVASAKIQGGGGLALYGGGITSVLNCKIYNNQALNEDGSGFQEGAAVYFASTNQDSKLVNNLIFNNKAKTVIFAGNHSKYFNNTIVNNIGYIYIANKTASYIWYNNIVWGNVNSNSIEAGIAGNPENTNVLLKNNYLDYVHGYSSLSGGNNIVSTANSPNFVLPTTFVGVAVTQADTTSVYTADFALKKESPCIDMGMSISEVTTDIKGNVRPQGTAFDAGAYEFDPKTTDFTIKAKNKYTLIPDVEGIRIIGIEGMEKVTVFTITGAKIFSQLTGNDPLIPLSSGIFVVQINKETFKAIVK